MHVMSHFCEEDHQFMSHFLEAKPSTPQCSDKFAMSASLLAHHAHTKPYIIPTADPKSIPLEPIHVYPTRRPLHYCANIKSALQQVCTPVFNHIPHLLPFSSCVTTIEECLSTLSPPPLSTQVSIVLQSVTVHHLEELSPQAIRLAILDAGFDVESNSPSASHSRQQKHIQQCLRCQKDLQDPPVSHHPEKGTGSFKATFSVGGMTCSSCSNTITDVVSQMSGVSDIVVSLLDGSATAIVDSKGMAEAVREAIDDCGFEARTVSVNLVHPRDYVEVEDTSRVISLRVDGMFCQYVHVFCCCL